MARWSGCCTLTILTWSTLCTPAWPRLGRVALALSYVCMAVILTWRRQRHDASVLQSWIERPTSRTACVKCISLITMAISGCQTCRGPCEGKVERRRPGGGDECKQRTAYSVRARLPGCVCCARDGRGRAGGTHSGGSVAPIHARLSLWQGEPIRRARA